MAFVIAVAVMAAQQNGPSQTMFEAARKMAVVDGDLAGAIKQYQAIVDQYRTDRAVTATALVKMAECYEKLGQSDAPRTYERVVSEFADQVESAATARTRLAALRAAGQVGQTVRLLWSDLGRSQGSPNMASPSADGRYVSFSEGEGDQAQGLGILDLKTGQILHVARTDLSENAASWGDVDGSAISPDGRQVAYIWEMEAGEELRVLQVNGGKASKSRSLHLNPGNSMSVGGWSPDGKSVVVVIQVGDAAKAQIAVISIADGAVRVLRENIPWGGKTWPRFSPDGRYVAYERRDSQTGSNDIFVLTLDGRETRVVEFPGLDSHPMWSPDGSHIVFLSNRTGNVSLWMIPVAGGTPTGPAKLIKANVGPLDGSEYGPFFPLGMTRNAALYYVAVNAITNVYTAELDGKLNAAAGPSIATNRYLNSNLNGVWSPDGQYLAYLATAPLGFFIRIQTVKTGEDRVVPARIPVSGPVRWFPDGQSLLVASRDARILNGQVGYYRVNIASGDAELLHQSASRHTVSIRPDLSSDGKTIFYLETPGQPVRFDVDSRRETRLTPLGSASEHDNQPWSLAVSPDGAQIAFLSPGRVVVLPAAGGEPRELVRLAGSSDPYERVDGLGGLAWSPDQRYLFFVKPDIRAIWRVSLAGGEAENVLSSKGRIRALRMHPDGRRLAFDLVDNPSELWVLENFLPRTAVK
jgi:Tol biopolymer transport system component